MEEEMKKKKMKEVREISRMEGKRRGKRGEGKGARGECTKPSKLGVGRTRRPAVPGA